MDQCLRLIKTDIVNEHFTSISCSLVPAISHVTLLSGYLFDSCQLTITWMSIIKLNTDWICLEHLSASKCDISHLLTLSLPKFLVCTDTVTKFYTHGAPMPRELRFGIFTWLMLARLIFSTPGLVMLAPKNLMAKFEPNIIVDVYSRPFPSKKIGRGRRAYSASLNSIRRGLEKFGSILAYVASVFNRVIARNLEREWKK